MKVYKFGGASVKDAAGVRNLADIVGSEGGRLFVIVSAMGKTTNALEDVLESFIAGERDAAARKLGDVIAYHDALVADLYPQPTPQPELARLYGDLRTIVSGSDPATATYEQWYDLLVGFGELFSTRIISDYLNSMGVANQWVDMRGCFVTSDRHRDANIDLDRSAEKLLAVVDSSPANIFIGQGFIGATEDGRPTTLGREGSDYSAAVAGYILSARSVEIWKDVEGILNGDPKIFPDATHIPELTYLDAIELAYSGAQIIHPKTIKPLQNKDIPLYVRSFLDKSKPGSVIKKEIDTPVSVPVLILKKNQILLTIRPLDYSFVVEERLTQIFSLLDGFGVKVNLIQSSAVNMTVCIDSSRYLEEIIARFQDEGYHAAYNTDMELLTIRGYTPQQQELYGESEDAYLVQRTRNSIRIVRRAAK